MYALDLTQPRGEPIVIDTTDWAELPLLQAFPFIDPRNVAPESLYAFQASDEVAAFRVPELGTDLNDNGRTGDVVRSGRL